MSKYTEYLSSQSASEQLKSDIYTKTTQPPRHNKKLGAPLKAMISVSAAVAALTLAIILFFTFTPGGTPEAAKVLYLTPGTVYEDRFGNTIALDRLEITRTVNYKGEEYTADGAFVVFYGTCDFTRELQDSEKQYYVFKNLTLTYNHIEIRETDTQIHGQFVSHKINGKYSDGAFRGDLLENNNSGGTLKGEYALVFEMDQDGVELFLGDIAEERVNGMYEFELDFLGLGFSAWDEEEGRYVGVYGARVSIDDAIINL